MSRELSLASFKSSDFGKVSPSVCLVLIWQLFKSHGPCPVDVHCPRRALSPSKCVYIPLSSSYQHKIVTTAPGAIPPTPQ